MASLNTENKVFMDKYEANISEKHYYLKNQINKKPFSLNNIKDSIIKSVEDYSETIDYENAYFNEKYYLNGLKDGIKLMSEIKK